MPLCLSLRIKLRLCQDSAFSQVLPDELLRVFRLAVRLDLPADLRRELVQLVEEKARKDDDPERGGDDAEEVADHVERAVRLHSDVLADGVVRGGEQDAQHEGAQRGADLGGKTGDASKRALKALHPFPLVEVRALNDQEVHQHADRDAADAGFDDEFIYEELSLAPAERQKMMEVLLPDESLAAFRMWKEKKDKRRY